MRIITGMFALLAFLGGLGALGFAFITPLGVSLSGASAIQVTQVYTQALFYAALGIGALLASIVAALSYISNVLVEILGQRSAAAGPTTGAPTPMGSKLGSL